MSGLWGVFTAGYKLHSSLSACVSAFLGAAEIWTQISACSGLSCPKANFLLNEHRESFCSASKIAKYWMLNAHTYDIFIPLECFYMLKTSISAKI